MTASDFSDCMPIRLYWQDSRLWVDWCDLGGRRLGEPFFDHTIENCLQHPYHLVFRRQTPIETLIELQTTQPGLRPNGFIFHLSRCGSTLVAQMLAALCENIVVSEASTIEAVFRAPANIPDEQRVAWLRALVSALGRPRLTEEKHFFVKFDAWHTVHLPLIQRAFPDVPWIFLYRDPIEVLVSTSLDSGGRLVPGAVDPALLDLDLAAACRMPAAEYHARILARICNAAIQHHQGDRTQLIDYTQLPEIVCSLLPGFFQFACSQSDRDRMRQRACFNGKGGRARFESDTAAKQRSASDAIRQAATVYMRGVYEELEARRLAQP